MKYRLSRIAVRIDHETVTAVSNAFTAREIRGELRQLSDYRGITRIRHPRNVLARYYENVYRRLRIDVAERDKILRLGDDLRRYFLAYDAAEQTGLGHV